MHGTADFEAWRLRGEEISKEIEGFGEERGTDTNQATVRNLPNERKEGASVKTVNVTHAVEGGRWPTAADVDPVATFEASVPAGNPDNPPLIIRVAVALGSGLPASYQHAHAEDIEARRRAQEEDAALEAEDLLAQAEEANATDPVG